MKAYSVLLLLFLLFNSTAKASTSPIKSQIDTLKKGKNYNLFNKTENIVSVVINQHKKPKENVVYIYFGYPQDIPSSNVVKGNLIGGKGENRITLPEFDKIDILRGKYEDIKISPDTKVRNLYKLSNIEFPLRLKLNYASENIDFELLEAGEWNIRLELKNN
jgi:hypothetical protein